MAARRLARQGLLLAAENQTPIASTSAVPVACPGCRRTASFAVSARQHDLRQQSSSWAAISRAGQAIFSQSKTHEPVQISQQDAAEPELTGTSAELVAELKLKRPDPQKCWALFQQVDLEGQTNRLSLMTLHFLLRSIHITPAKSAHLDVETATKAARIYQSKAEFIRLRIRQAGGAVSQGDLLAMLWQYHALRYAPGAAQVWEEMISLGYVPSVITCERTFETLLGWIDLHLRSGGKQVARVAAEPLVRKAVAMMEQLRGDVKRTNAVLHFFFKIALRARDERVFFLAMKEVYGFDVNYPGAQPVVPPNTRSTLRKMGEQEVCWVLEMLGEQDDFSKMIAVFEVFDHPGPDIEPAYFARSFANKTLDSDAGQVDALPMRAVHPIGTRAFAQMVHTAARQRNGALVRHYFDQLMSRWQYDTAKRIERLEKVVGIDSSVQPTDTQDGVKRPHVINERPLGMPIASPERPYAVPSSLVRDVIRDAKLRYDHPTSRWIRHRTKRVLQLMSEHTERITAVLDKLEPALRASRQTPLSEAGPAPAPQSLFMLAYEIDQIEFHRTQLRHMYHVFKADAHIIAAYSVQRGRSSGLTRRLARLHDKFGVPASATTTVASATALRKLPADERNLLVRKQTRVLLARVQTVKERITRLHRLGRAAPGRKEFESLKSELYDLQAQAKQRGLVKPEIEESEDGVAAGTSGSAMAA